MTENGSERSNFEGKTKHALIKEKIVATKQFNPRLKAKEIALQVGTTTNYVYKVWSVFVRKQVKLSRGANGKIPLVPFHVHGWYYYNQVPASWYVRCPYGIVDNRNKMKLSQTNLYTFTMYPSGSVFVNPFFRELTTWKDLLREELGKWLFDDEIRLFVDSLCMEGQKSFAAHTPDVPKNYNFHVKGIGKFKTDTTPYPDGTTEFEIDVGYENRIKTIEGNMDKVAIALLKQVEQMETFRISMKEHLALIKQLQEIASGLKDTITGLKAFTGLDLIEKEMREIKKRKRPEWYS